MDARGCSAAPRRRPRGLGDGAHAGRLVFLVRRLGERVWIWTQTALERGEATCQIIPRVVLGWTRCALGVFSLMVCGLTLCSLPPCAWAGVFMLLCRIEGLFTTNCHCDESTYLSSLRADRLAPPHRAMDVVAQSLVTSITTISHYFSRLRWRYPGAPTSRNTPIALGLDP
ncbi:hypothetical protein DL93DRAFT_1784939 [Clavulina sp. PMI_390]|nr:hypothetical protein DL93DRAFT_1784939 [Clavulina sp. PMI_390]